MKIAWAGSDRASRLPRDWPKLRLLILERDRYICYLCGLPGANEVDHIRRGDNHHPSNLASAHSHCHRDKTQREAREALPKRARQAEPHPGLRRKA